MLGTLSAASAAVKRFQKIRFPPNVDNCVETMCTVRSRFVRGCGHGFMSPLGRPAGSFVLGTCGYPGLQCVVQIREEVKVEEDCVILDIPEGLRLNLLGLVVQIDRVSITADRAGLLGGLLASLTCGGAAAADQLDALAQMVRAREIAPEEPAQDEEQEPETEEEPAQPSRRRARGGRGRG